LRECQHSVASIIELAEQGKNAENLYHLVTCNACREYVQKRDPSSSEENKVILLCAAIKRIEEAVKQKMQTRSLRIQRHLVRAQAR